jgi:hypothetical protein
MSPLDFRVALQDQGSAPSQPTDVPQAAPEAQEGDAAGQEPQFCRPSGTGRRGAHSGQA